MFWKRKLNKEEEHEVVDMSERGGISERKKQPLTKMEMSIIEEQEEEQKIKEYNKSIASSSKIDEDNVIAGIKEINRKLNSDMIWHRELVNRSIYPLYYAVVVGKTDIYRERKFSRGELSKIVAHFREKGFEVRIAPEDRRNHEHVEVFIAWHK